MKQLETNARVFFPECFRHPGTPKRLQAASSSLKQLEADSEHTDPDPPNSTSASTDEFQNRCRTPTSRSAKLRTDRANKAK
eukprot:7571834-Alexandrium_andersonii.AAC.1